MPPQFAQFLKFVRGHLYFNPDYIVVLDQYEWEKRKLSKIDIMQSIEHLRNNDVAVQMRIYNDVWHGMGIPATPEGRLAMLNGSWRTRAKHWLAGMGEQGKFKIQIALKIDRKFDDFYTKLTGKTEMPQPLIYKAEFLPKKSALKVGDKLISLPPYKNEFDLCRVMFQSVIGEPVDWSLVYEEMSKKDEPDEKAKKRIYDACSAVNERLQEFGFPELFIWEAKTIRRAY